MIDKSVEEITKIEVFEKLLKELLKQILNISKNNERFSNRSEKISL